MPLKYKQSDEYSEIFNRIIELCERNNTTVTSIVKEFTSSTSKLDTWKKGNIKPNIIPQIALKLNTSLDYLLTGKEKNSSSEQLSEEEQKVLKYFKELPPNEQQQLIGMAMLLKKQTETPQESNQAVKEMNNKSARNPHTEMIIIRKYTYPVGAGTNDIPPKDDDYHNIKIPSDYVPRKANSLIRVSGESMEPDYPNNCYIWVNMGIIDGKKEDFYGKPVIARNNNVLLFKIAEKDYLRSINNKFPKIFAGEGCKIIGSVIEIAEDKVVEFIKNIE